MTDYRLGKIYKIVNLNDRGKIYVGSTCDDLSKRMYRHKAHSKQKPERHFYKAVTEEGGWDNFTIVLIEEYACNTKNQLVAREQYYCDLLKPVYNKSKAYVGLPRNEYIKQYAQEHEERIKENQAKWRENNKDRKKQTDKAYHERNKEKCKAQNKANREKKLLDPVFVEQEKLRHSKPTECKICNITMRYDSIAKHNKTKKHLDNLTNSNQV